MIEIEKKVRKKYGNKKYLHDGIKFDSKMELDYYLYLIENGTRKEDIILQPQFVLFDTDKDNKGNTLRKVKYIADFQIDNIVIDIKGMITPVFSLKEAIFKRKFKQYELLVLTKAPKWSGVDWIDVKLLKSLRNKRKKLKEVK